MSADLPHRRVAAIDRCRLVFGVPLDLAGFRADLDRGDKDFVRNCCPVWPLYRDQVAEPALRVVAEARKLGAAVTTNATLDDFGSLFREPTDLVILITHWVGDVIELSDGMHSVGALVDRVPIAFDGAFDLCVCHPEPLAVALRDFRPDCVIHYPRREAVPRIWFAYVRALLWRLAVGGCSYLDAATEVIGAFLLHPGERKVA